VFVGMAGVKVEVGEGISVFVAGISGVAVNVGLETTAPPGVGEKIIGVAVIMPGVREGISVELGNG